MGVPGLGIEENEFGIAREIVLGWPREIRATLSARLQLL